MKANTPTTKNPAAATIKSLLSFSGKTQEDMRREFGYRHRQQFSLKLGRQALSVTELRRIAASCGVRLAFVDNLGRQVVAFPAYGALARPEEVVPWEAVSGPERRSLLGPDPLPEGLTPLCAVLDIGHEYYGALVKNKDLGYCVARSGALRPIAAEDALAVLAACKKAKEDE